MFSPCMIPNFFVKLHWANIFPKYHIHKLEWALSVTRSHSQSQSHCLMSDVSRVTYTAIDINV